MSDFTKEDIDFSSKTIEQYREDLTDIVKRSVDSFVQEVTECKEEILLAFMAKYGCNPDEIVACQMTKHNGVTVFWVEKKQEQQSEELHTTKEENNVRYSIRFYKRFTTRIYQFDEGNQGKIYRAG